ncbi:hypothetical protein OG384_04475 [Streptomyces sp. NBC_01324]|uniref:hypothetical protein n=1 Tax=Streptomyces sp. NBC_01324 TaxID=2903826 RepID=UPI002E1317B1|nr:hypothetical protein OG384_04475 [Streptomyces sp. NBC_01324]
MDRTQVLAPTSTLSPADVAAHEAASYVRRPAVIAAQDSPKPPAARRRFVQQRERL